jgi:hypothetical protein
MHLDQPGPRIGYRGGALSRAKQLALKALVVVGGVLMLASAFLLSLVFLAIGSALVLTVGGYLWWRTRALRRQMRARMQAALQPQFGGEVIEGEVVSEARKPRR